ncbi:MAG: hypothetical protein ACREID_09785 [Planctomycetota bacterium]
MGHLLLRSIPLFALVAACATTEVAEPPRAAESSGRGLYEASCGRCHALYMPSSFTAEEWRFFVGKYGRRARLRAEEKERVLDYLVRHAGG